MVLPKSDLPLGPTTRRGFSRVGVAVNERYAYLIIRDGPVIHFSVFEEGEVVVRSHARF
jgi:hypothetical protein